MNASVDIIAKEGVRALSFRDVARKANVSHQAPYHYFKNHHEILRAIAAEGFLKLGDDMDQAAAKHKNPLKSLSASGVAYVKFATENLGHFRVMFQKSLIGLHKKDSTIPEAEYAHGVLLKLSAAAHAKGTGKSMDVETLALLCWASVHGIANLITEGIVEADTPKSKTHIASLITNTLSELLSQ